MKLFKNLMIIIIISLMIGYSYSQDTLLVEGDYTDIINFNSQTEDSINHEFWQFGKLEETSSSTSNIAVESFGKMLYLAALISLPIVGGLLLIQCSIGIITRSAPSLNLFSFGFPITIMMAFIMLFFATRSMGGAFAELIKNAITALENMLGVI